MSYKSSKLNVINDSLTPICLLAKNTPSPFWIPATWIYVSSSKSSLNPVQSIGLTMNRFTCGSFDHLNFLEIKKQLGQKPFLQFKIFLNCLTLRKQKKK